MTYDLVDLHSLMLYVDRPINMSGLARSTGFRYASHDVDSFRVFDKVLSFFLIINIFTHCAIWIHFVYFTQKSFLWRSQIAHLGKSCIIRKNRHWPQSTRLMCLRGYDFLMIEIEETCDKKILQLKYDCNTW